MHEHVFISYAREDAHIAERLEHALDERGYNCWRDVSIRGGQVWPDVLAQKIAEAHTLLVLATDRAARSEWVKQEISAAQSLGKTIVPVKTAADIPKSFRGILGETHFITARNEQVDDYVTGQLVAALRLDGLGLLHDPVDEGLDWEFLTTSFCELGEGDRERLDRIADLVRRSFQTTPGPPIWSVHGIRHADGLLRALADILDDGDKDTRHSAFCAIAAACLHDIGLVLPGSRKAREEEDRARWPAPRMSESSSEGGQEAVEEPDLEASRRLQRDLSRHHAKRSADYVRNHAGALGLDPQEARTIEHLARYHNPTANMHTLADKPEDARLASAFRLANICDTGPHRAPMDIWANQKDKIKSHEQAAFWLVNLMTSAVLVDRDARAITVCGRAPSEELLFLPRQLQAEIGSRRRALTPFVGVWDVEFDARPDPTLDLGIQPEDIALSGLRFLAAPRATLGSSSDLVDYFLAAAAAIAPKGCAEAYRGEMLAGPEDLSHKTKTRKLEKLNTMVQELVATRGELHSLHSLRKRLEEAWDSPNADRNIDRTLRTVRVLREERRFCPVRHRDDDAPKTVFGRIAFNAYHVAAERNSAGPLRFFAFGKSGPVTHFLHYCALAGREVEVFTPVLRPVGEGPGLQVSEALEGMDGVRVEVVPDAAIAHVLDELKAPWNGQARAEGVCPGAVLMGCEAVFQEDGQDVASVGTSLGALTVSYAAQAAGVPVWVLTDEAKFVAAKKESPWWRGEQINRLPAVSFMYEPDAAAWAEKSGRMYPRSETVPGRYIEYIITESKALAPAEALAAIVAL